MPKRNALISVSDKENIVEFAKRLVALDFNIIASGGTAKILEANGVKVTSTAKVINVYARDLLKKNKIKITPEIEHALGGAILDHRVVTLSREIHGGILARKDHLEELSKLMIPWIDLVCVDFYPFEKTITKPGITMYEAIEQDDVGGPTMIHSAAKGAQEGRIVIGDPKDRELVLTLMEQSADKDLTVEKKNELASKADYIVSKYCMMVSTYRSSKNFVGIFGEKVATCKYGENAHQTPAALYSNGSSDPLALDQFKVIEGVLPSYNNYCDIYRMTQIATHIAGAFDKNNKKVPLMAIGVKHGNPCGTAIGTNPKQVLKKMMSGDPLSIFGGLVMTNFPIDDKLVGELSGKMLDGIIAPSFTNDAIEKLKRKGNKCRFVVNKELLKLNIKSIDTAPYFRYVRGGFLEQPNYAFILDLKAPKMKQYGKMSISQKNDLLLAWAIGSTSNSNTISIVKNGQLIGNGVGQQDRVGAAKLAIERAKRSKHILKGASAFSDSFFPFPDAPQVLIKAGITSILTTSGSVKDDLTIELCKKTKTGLYMIPDSLARGFFGH